MLNDVKHIIKRLKNDDKSVVDELYELYHAKIYGFALSYLKDEDDALDIVQESFIKLWENRHKINDEMRLDAFLLTTVKNSVISLFRKKKSQNKYADYLVNSQFNNNSSTVINKLRSIVLVSALTL